MKISRRDLLVGASAVAIAPRAQAWSHGSSSVSINRVLIIAYGQSNMDATFQAISGSPPTPLSGTSYYNGSSIVSPAGNVGDGIINAMNQIKTATGLNVLCLNGAVGGAGLSGLMQGQSAFTNLISQIQAVIQATDQCVIIWDQGEGDANAIPPEGSAFYWQNLGTLHGQITSAIGRTKATCPFFTCQLGTASGFSPSGTITGGTSPYSWQSIKNAQFDATTLNPFMFYSHSNIDYTRTDGYHYDTPSCTKNGNRFGQAITTWLGHASGYPNWFIVGAASVDATHTNVNLAQNLGTDFTPTSGIQGFEVSGDNGATWSTPSAAVRNSATQIGLTHASLTTTSARLVRYQYGDAPPGVDPTCNGTTVPGPCTPNACVLDNSFLNAPLNPTVWNVRSAPTGSNLPMPVWRDSAATLSSGASQQTAAMLLGPSSDNYQKFVVLSVVSGFTPAVQPMTLMLIPSVGSAITLSLVAAHGYCLIYAGLLGTDANSALTCTLDLEFSGNPFTNYVTQLWTVQASLMNSTTSTGNGSATAASSTTVSTTCNVSAGGFAIVVATNTATSSPNSTTASITSGYALEYQAPSAFGLGADGANLAASASSPCSVTFSDSGSCDILMAAWR